MGRLFNKENPTGLKSSGYFSTEPQGKSSGWGVGNVAATISILIIIAIICGTISWIEHSFASLGDSPLFFISTVLAFCAAIPYICLVSLIVIFFTVTLVKIFS
ncbi:hypothetical protein [Piscirickettsia salmonis]|uniref:hypothetical protein n=1 Tax=Piscirickettsia salmonis TaxID=1238 RepID=UPI0007C8BB8C|nr:hypothetical protein A0O36_02437 [Piscirickettsiaceae bacterium NZ-RLO1]